ncbi:hypothetical protein HY338_01045 [Candidatus Gottesmanbacteria bacterium]|nr:hypothetical protein [Candidatus Gottesmanbacteria bacterium]
MSPLEREKLSLHVTQPGEAGPPEDWVKGFQEGAIGIYAPGALGMAMAHNLGTDKFITRAGSRSARLFANDVDLHIVTGEGQNQTQSTLHGKFSPGLVETYKSGSLPEVVIACPNADKAPDLVAELVDLTYAFADDCVLHVTSEGELCGLDRLPAIVLASNGILDESVRERVGQVMLSIATDEQTGEALASAWLEKIVRGLSYVSAERSGFGLAATYKPSTVGVVTLTGGEQETRERIIKLTKERGGIRFLDRGSETVEYEWRKAYTNLMTNVLALTLCFDHRKGTPRLNIPVGRILQRMKPANSATYTELEGERELFEHLGKAFYAIAKNKGLFRDFETWQDFNQKVFLDPIKDPQSFYTHVPSSLQMVANQVRIGKLADGIPPNEEQIIAALITETQGGNEELNEAQETLEASAEMIKRNIASIKEVYRRPQVVELTEGTIRRIFNQTGEIGYIAFQPEKIGLTDRQAKPYVTRATDIDKTGEFVIPMTAEVFAYGPEKIPGNIALITNGAGFTLEALDRCVEAGVRLGFISDLRLQFEEGKYYLAMKMALAANPAIDTIAIDVLTTLGTSADVARAVKRISSENTGLKFVIKLEGREQIEGIEILQDLRKKGVDIIFTNTREILPSSQVQPLTLDQMIRVLRMRDGMELDGNYSMFENFHEDKLDLVLKHALAQRLRHLLIPTALSEDKARELDSLRQKNMLSHEAIFGREFVPCRGKEALTGKPVVVIAGYGDTARLQARLMREARTEVILLHPQINEKVTPGELEELRSYGIRTYSKKDELKTDLDISYPDGVDCIGICYEPYKPEIGDGGIYIERVEKAVDLLIELKTNAGLQVRSILIPTEMVPTAGAKNILAKCKQAGIWFIGPNSPGMSRVIREYPGAHLKVAQIPPQCILAGDIAVVGVGGTMLFETLSELKREGQGITWAISLGGDRTRGISARDAALIAENDPKTKYFIYQGEPGGFAAQELAEVMQAGLISKPVIVKEIGHSMPDNCYIGHAGAVTHGSNYERTDVKIGILRQAGAIIVHTPEQMAQVMTFIEMHPNFGRIDTRSNTFLAAQKVMSNLASTQNSVIDGLTDKV